MKTSTPVLMDKITLLLEQWPDMTPERREDELAILQAALEVHTTPGKLPTSTGSLLGGLPRVMMLSQLLDKIHTETSLALTTAGHLPQRSLHANIYNNLQSSIALIEYARRNM